MPEAPPTFNNHSLEEMTQARNFFEAFRAAPPPRITFALIAINVLVFAAMVASGISFTNPTPLDAFRFGANYGPAVVHGQWWRLLTACFVHYGVIHIGMNMIILYQVGIFTEKLYGSVRYLCTYLIAGIGGNLAGLLIHPDAVGAGASGAVFGIYGAMLAFLLMQRGTVPTSTSLPIAKSAGIFLGINLIYGLSSPHTDLTAHIGGLISGFAVGCLLARPLPYKIQAK